MIPFSRRGREAAMPDVTPLVDVVFILLIFFVIASAFAVHGMDMDLPESSSARMYAGRSVEIVLNANDELLCDGKPATLRDLGFVIRRECSIEAGSQPKQVLFKASPEASVGQFMRTVDVIRSNGGERLVIATKNASPESEGQ